MLYVNDMEVPFNEEKLVMIPSISHVSPSWLGMVLFTV